MKAKFAFLLLGVGAMMLLPTNGSTRWGPAGCPAAGPVGPTQPVASLEWWVYPQNPGQAFLYDGSRMVGGWDYGAKLFRPFNGSTWGPAGVPPITPPLPYEPSGASLPTGVESPKKELETPKQEPEKKPRLLKDEPPQLEPWQLAGVVEEKIVATDSFNLCGKAVTQCRAYQAVDSSLTDDSDKLYVVIASKDKSTRERVRDDFLADVKLADLRSRCNVWCQPFDHFSMLDHRTGQSLFSPKGDVLVMLQDKDGHVLHRQDDYKGIDDLGALRRADPKYDPSKDPDLRKPQPKPGPTPNEPSPSPSPVLDWVKANPVTVILGASVLLLLIVNKPQEKK